MLFTISRKVNTEEFYQEQLHFINEQFRNKGKLIVSQTEYIISINDDDRFFKNINDNDDHNNNINNNHDNVDHCHANDINSNDYDFFDNSKNFQINNSHSNKNPSNKSKLSSIHYNSDYNRYNISNDNNKFPSTKFYGNSTVSNNDSKSFST